MEQGRFVVPLAAFAALFLAYILAFSIPMGLSGSAFLSALTNVAALAVCTVPTVALLQAVKPSRFGIPVRIVFHALAAVGFAYAWYFVILVGFATAADWIRNGLVARAFNENSLVWQIYQGITLYAMILLYIEWRAAGHRQTNGETDAGTRTEGHLLLRDGNEIIGVDHTDIVRLSGAGDYVEIATAVRTFLSNRTLTAFAESLPEDFVRVHRSHIIRQGAIVRAEPAGNGRLTLHLSDGEAVTTSRDGARLIRQISA
ncbi:LytR/AlgR family response regulator transcription factor [Parasphingopyxis marina]|uniref:LytTR family transcriptional regulator n=1 Tax=Parasphingopyxis marina TaxID=2761622 RepID=A0A842I0M2_9SPHN|nr:LytTR family DNA-binding domain-containing protein [Parasphingopyxis marina]MBC2777304.1 LytTR family transcriptional regulator [Parasphingopyxis marina]